MQEQAVFTRQQPETMSHCWQEITQEPIGFSVYGLDFQYGEAVL